MDQEKKIKRIDRAKDKSRVREKDSERLKVEENVFDIPTLKILYTLSNKGIIKAMGGAISTGKEANVFYAEGPDKELAVKIYRIAGSTFKAMDAYIMRTLVSQTFETISETSFLHGHAKSFRI